MLQKLKCHYNGKACHLNVEYGKGKYDLEHGKMTKKQELLKKRKKMTKKFTILFLLKLRQVFNFVFDFGASKHMTNKFDLFVELVEDKSTLHLVILGDDRTHFVEGRGNVEIKLGGKTFKFKDVLYTPSLRKNLLSMSE
jgi:hypothetical protein